MSESNDTIVIFKKPEITLNYDKKQFNQIFFERCGIDKVASTLLVQGYCRDLEDRWDDRYQPDIDILHVNKNQFIHYKRVVCNLEIFSSGIYSPIKTFYSKQRLIFLLTNTGKNVENLGLGSRHFRGGFSSKKILHWDFHFAII